MSEFDAVERFGIAGRAILVTGATGHLGRPIAEAIAAAGGIAIVAARSTERLTTLMREIETQGGRCSSVAFDIGDPEQCRAAVAQILGQTGRLDGIVNCAYSSRISTLEHTPPADFALAWNQHVVGPFTMLQAALPALRAAGLRLEGGASIVNIGSMYGHVSPDPRIYGSSGKNSPPPYGAAKAGLLQLTRYLAVHLGPERIRVNSVSPGPFPLPTIADSDPEFHARLCERTPLGRIGAARELVGPVIFLLSDAASYVTGADLAVDGGWTAW